MIGRRLVNGVESSAIAVDDRGLQYGDGLFETMAAVDGRVRNLERHLDRLGEGCRRLGIPMPERAQIEAECERALEGLGVGGGHRSMAKGIIPLKAFREIYGRTDQAQIRSALFDAFMRAIRRDES